MFRHIRRVAAADFVRAQTSRDTYTEPLDLKGVHGRELSDFLYNHKRTFTDVDAKAVLAQYEVVRNFHTELVPDKVTEQDFWARYCYRCNKERIMKDLELEDPVDVKNRSDELVDPVEVKQRAKAFEKAVSNRVDSTKPTPGSCIESTGFSKSNKAILPPAFSVRKPYDQKLAVNETQVIGTKRFATATPEALKSKLSPPPSDIRSTHEKKMTVVNDDKVIGTNRFVMTAAGPETKSSISAPVSGGGVPQEHKFPDNNTNKVFGTKKFVVTTPGQEAKTGNPAPPSTKGIATKKFAISTPEAKPSIQDVGHSSTVNNNHAVATKKVFKTITPEATTSNPAPSSEVDDQRLKPLIVNENKIVKSKIFAVSDPKVKPIKSASEVGVGNQPVKKFSVKENNDIGKKKFPPSTTEAKVSHPVHVPRVSNPYSKTLTVNEHNVVGAKKVEAPTSESTNKSTESERRENNLARSTSIQGEALNRSVVQQTTDTAASKRPTFAEVKPFSGTGKPTKFQGVAHSFNAKVPAPETGPGAIIADSAGPSRDLPRTTSLSERSRVFGGMAFNPKVPAPETRPVSIAADSTVPSRDLPRTVSLSERSRVFGGMAVVPKVPVPETRPVSIIADSIVPSRDLPRTTSLSERSKAFGGMKTKAVDSLAGKRKSEDEGRPATHSRKVKASTQLSEDLSSSSSKSLGVQHGKAERFRHVQEARLADLRRLEEARLRAEKARLDEDARIEAEKARQADENRLAEAATRARVEEEARKADVARMAEQEKQAEAAEQKRVRELERKRLHEARPCEAKQQEEVNLIKTREDEAADRKLQKATLEVVEQKRFEAEKAQEEMFPEQQDFEVEQKAEAKEMKLGTEQAECCTAEKRMIAEEQHKQDEIRQLRLLEERTLQNTRQEAEDAEWKKLEEKAEEKRLHEAIEQTRPEAERAQEKTLSLQHHVEENQEKVQVERIKLETLRADNAERKRLKEEEAEEKRLHKAIEQTRFEAERAQEKTLSLQHHVEEKLETLRAEEQGKQDDTGQVQVEQIKLETPRVEEQGKQDDLGQEKLFEKMILQNTREEAVAVERKTLKEEEAEKKRLCEEIEQMRIEAERAQEKRLSLPQHVEEQDQKKAEAEQIKVEMEQAEYDTVEERKKSEEVRIEEEIERQRLSEGKVLQERMEQIRLAMLVEEKLRQTDTEQLGQDKVLEKAEVGSQEFDRHILGHIPALQSNHKQAEHQRLVGRKPDYDMSLCADKKAENSNATLATEPRLNEPIGPAEAQSHPFIALEEAVEHHVLVHEVGITQLEKSIVDESGDNSMDPSSEELYLTTQANKHKMASTIERSDSSTHCNEEMIVGVSHGVFLEEYTPISPELVGLHGHGFSRDGLLDESAILPPLATETASKVDQEFPAEEAWKDQRKLAVRAPTLKQTADDSILSSAIPLMESTDALAVLETNIETTLECAIHEPPNSAALPEEGSRKGTDSEQDGAEESLFTDVLDEMDVVATSQVGMEELQGQEVTPKDDKYAKNHSFLESGSPDDQVTVKYPTNTAEDAANFKSCIEGGSTEVDLDAHASRSDSDLDLMRSVAASQKSRERTDVEGNAFKISSNAPDLRHCALPEEDEAIENVTASDFVGSVLMNETETLHEPSRQIQETEQMPPSQGNMVHDKATGVHVTAEPENQPVASILNDRAVKPFDGIPIIQLSAVSTSGPDDSHSSSLEPQQRMQAAEMKSDTPIDPENQLPAVQAAAIEPETSFDPGNQVLTEEADVTESNCSPELMAMKVTKHAVEKQHSVRSTIASTLENDWPIDEYMDQPTLAHGAAVDTSNVGVEPVPIAQELIPVPSELHSAEPDSNYLDKPKAINADDKTPATSPGGSSTALDVTHDACKSISSSKEAENFEPVSDRAINELTHRGPVSSIPPNPSKKKKKKKADPQLTVGSDEVPAKKTNKKKSASKSAFLKDDGEAVQEEKVVKKKVKKVKTKNGDQGIEPMGDVEVKLKEELTEVDREFESSKKNLEEGPDHEMKLKKVSGHDKKLKRVSGHEKKRKKVSGHEKKLKNESAPEKKVKNVSGHEKKGKKKKKSKTETQVLDSLVSHSEAVNFIDEGPSQCGPSEIANGNDAEEFQMPRCNLTLPLKSSKPGNEVDPVGTEAKFEADSHLESTKNKEQNAPLPINDTDADIHSDIETQNSLKVDNEVITRSDLEEGPGKLSNPMEPDALTRKEHFMDGTPASIALTEKGTHQRILDTHGFEDNYSRKVSVMNDLMEVGESMRGIHEPCIGHMCKDDSSISLQLETPPLEHKVDLWKHDVQPLKKEIIEIGEDGKGPSNPLDPLSNQTDSVGDSDLPEESDGVSDMPEGKEWFQAGKKEQGGNKVDPLGTGAKSEADSDTESTINEGRNAQLQTNDTNADVHSDIETQSSLKVDNQGNARSYLEDRSGQPSNPTKPDASDHFMDGTPTSIALAEKGTHQQILDTHGFGDNYFRKVSILNDLEEEGESMRGIHDPCMRKDDSPISLQFEIPPLEHKVDLWKQDVQPLKEEITEVGEDGKGASNPLDPLSNQTDSVGDSDLPEESDGVSDMLEGKKWVQTGEEEQQDIEGKALEDTTDNTCIFAQPEGVDGDYNINQGTDQVPQMVPPNAAVPVPQSEPTGANIAGSARANLGSSRLTDDIEQTDTVTDSGTLTDTVQSCNDESLINVVGDHHRLEEEAKNTSGDKAVQHEAERENGHCFEVRSLDVSSATDSGDSNESHRGKFDDDEPADNEFPVGDQFPSPALNQDPDYQISCHSELGALPEDSNKDAIGQASGPAPLSNKKQKQGNIFGMLKTALSPLQQRTPSVTLDDAREKQKELLKQKMRELEMHDLEEEIEAQEVTQDLLIKQALEDSDTRKDVTITAHPTVEADTVNLNTGTDNEESGRGMKSDSNFSGEMMNSALQPLHQTASKLSLDNVKDHQIELLNENYREREMDEKGDKIETQEKTQGLSILQSVTHCTPEIGVETCPQGSTAAARDNGGASVKIEEENGELDSNGVILTPTSVKIEEENDSNRVIFSSKASNILKEGSESMLAQSQKLVGFLGGLKTSLVQLQQTTKQMSLNVPKEKQKELLMTQCEDVNMDENLSSGDVQSLFVMQALDRSKSKLETISDKTTPPVDGGSSRWSFKLEAALKSDVHLSDRDSKPTSTRVNPVDNSDRPAVEFGAQSSLDEENLQSSFILKAMDKSSHSSDRDSKPTRTRGNSVGSSDRPAVEFGARGSLDEGNAQASFILKAMDKSSLSRLNSPHSFNIRKGFSGSPNRDRDADSLDNSFVDQNSQASFSLEAMEKSESSMSQSSLPSDSKKWGGSQTDVGTGTTDSDLAPFQPSNALLESSVVATTQDPSKQHQQNRGNSFWSFGARILAEASQKIEKVQSQSLESEKARQRDLMEAKLREIEVLNDLDQLEKSQKELVRQTIHGNRRNIASSTPPKEAFRKKKNIEIQSNDEPDPPRQDNGATAQVQVESSLDSTSVKGAAIESDITRIEKDEASEHKSGRQSTDDDLMLPGRAAIVSDSDAKRMRVIAMMQKLERYKDV